MSRLLISMEYYMGVVLELLPVAVLAGVICVLIRWRIGKRLTSCRGLVTVLFACYMAGLLALTAVPNHLWSHIWYVLRHHQSSGITFHLFTFEHNLVPDFWKNFGPEKLANLVLYIPFGLCAPLLWKKVNGWKVLALGFALSLCIETIQLFVGRSLDANDLILNTVGAVTGYGLFILLRTALPRFTEKCQDTKL